MKKILCTAILAAIPALAFAATAATPQTSPCGGAGAPCPMMGTATDHSQCEFSKPALAAPRAERDGRR
jgi:hypothetical protein